MSLILAGYLGFSLFQTGHDKALHFVTFLVLTAEFYFIFDTNHKSLKTLRYVTLLVCTCAGSVLLEVVQSLVNSARVFDVYDIVANVCGSVVAVAACSGWDVWATKRQRQRRYQQVRAAVEGEAENGFVNIDMANIDDSEESPGFASEQPLSRV